MGILTRIGGGGLKGRKIEIPEGIRPTTLRVRQALFDIWCGEIAGVLFLDLYAGSGAVGLEAVSRGAARAVLVERGGPALTVLRRNCRRLAPARTVPIPGRLPEFLAALGREWGPAFRLVFADPPYDFRDFPPLLQGVSGLCAAGGEAVVEHSRRVETPPEGPAFVRDRVRTHGDTSLSFYRFRAGESERHER